MTLSRARHKSMTRVRPAEEVAIRQDLTVGLHTVTEINQVIRYADHKAGALAAVQALAVSVLAAKRDAVAAHPITTGLALTCLAGVLASAILLSAGQFARLARSSRLGFPSLATMPLADVVERPPLARQHEQVWRQASELARIAMVKFRWLHRAMISTLVTLTAVLLWLGLTTWLSQR